MTDKTDDICDKLMNMSPQEILTKIICLGPIDRNILDTETGIKFLNVLVTAYFIQCIETMNRYLPEELKTSTDGSENIVPVYQLKIMDLV